MLRVLARRALPGLAVALGLLGASSAAASAAPITECTDSAVRAAVAAGGAHTFACDGSILLESPLIVTGGNLTLDGAGRTVTLTVYGRQVLQARGGEVTLRRLEIRGTHTSRLLDGGRPDGVGAGWEGARGDSARQGTPGQDGKDGTQTAAATAGGDATASTDATDGTDAPGVAKVVDGGALHVSAGASVLLSEVAFVDNSVLGGYGATGGNAGLAWAGAWGGKGGDNSYGAGAPGGDGADAGHAGNAGDGTPGAAGRGGAIYNAGTLRVEDSRFVGNSALGGLGGYGGQAHPTRLPSGPYQHGGAGGQGGSGCRTCGQGRGGNAGDGANGGNGGNGGDTGDGLGGAIYNSGSLTVVRSNFTGNAAEGHRGASGGSGGEGGPGGAGGSGRCTSDGHCSAGGAGGNGGNGGNGGQSGDGGDAFGGAIYSDEPFEQSGNAFSNNKATAFSSTCCAPSAGKAGAGGRGGDSHPQDGPAGAAGDAGDAGAMGRPGESGCGDVYPPDPADAGGVPATATGSPCGCRLDQEVAGWKLDAKCPPADGLTKEITGVSITSPSGWKLAMPEGNPTNYALPLDDTGAALQLPIVLPDLDVSVGGLSVGAYANTLDHDGLRIGTGWFELPAIKTEGLVEDLHIGEGFKGSAGSVELDLFGAASLEASDVQFSDQGVKASEFEVGLPTVMGGAAVAGRNLEIGPGGVSGELTGAEIAIGELSARFDEARLTPSGISIGSAELKLPPYLGNATLRATGLSYDAGTGQLGIESAHGDVEFTVAGRAKVKAEVDLSLDPDGGFHLSGAGSLRIGEGEPPPFETSAAIEVRSVKCDPAPGPCSNAAFLHTATLTVKPGVRMPLGQTGLALTSLGGSVKSTQDQPRRDGDGVIHGVSYTFGLKAGLATLPDNGFAFDGQVGATASTNGNLAMDFSDARIFKFIRVYGEICARLVDIPDAVCDRLNRQDLAQRRGTGVFVGGGAEAGVEYDGGRLFRASAQLKLATTGSIVNAGGETYLDATAEGTLSTKTGGWLLPDIEGSGTLRGEIGRFTAPSGKRTLGVKGLLNAKLKVRSIFGDREESVQRAIFIDSDGNYTEENVDGYSLAGPGSRRLVAAAQRSRMHAFAIPAGQKQTMVVVDAARGAPKVTLTAPGGMRIVAAARPGKDPTIWVKSARGKKVDRKLAARIFVVRSREPGSVAVYLPSPPSGRWSAKVDGVKAGSYRFHAGGNRPLPRLEVTAPAKGKTLRATPAKPAVTLQGKVADAPKKAAVTVYASAEPCVKRGGELGPPAPGIELAARVKLSKKGGWSLKWNTAGVAPGRYVPYAVLANGSGPRVGNCAKGAVQVDERGTRRAPAPRPKPAAPAASAAATSPVVIVGPKGGCEKIATLQPGLGSPPPAPKVETGLPILKVSQEKTPCIAANIAAAMTRTDPFSQTPAVTVPRDARDYSLHPGGAPATLTYAPHSSPDKPSVARKNRDYACGQRPFKNGHAPGPPDGKLDANTGTRSGGSLTSCDEYPYASSLEGGRQSGALIVRGVELRENRVQGGELSAFLRNNATELAYGTGSSGRFNVCVQVSPPVGNCAP